jgi:hypothetical protein
VKKLILPQSRLSRACARMVHNRILSTFNRFLQDIGKQWHEQKKPFRPTSGLSSYAQRLEKRKATDSMKAKEREMKEETEATRQVNSFTS